MSDTRAQRKVQELGRKIVGGLFMIIRNLRLYDLENDIFVKPLHELESAINIVIAQEGVVSLYGADSTIYLNQHLLKFDRKSLENVNFLLAEFARLNLAGFLVEQTLTTGQLQEFLWQFGPDSEAMDLKASVFQGQAIERVRERLQRIEEEEIRQALELKADRKRYAVLLYGRLLMSVRALYNPQQKDPTDAKIRHTIQEVIDVCVGQPVQFLGFSNDSNADAYQAYHITNTVFLAILLGDNVGLERTQLLDLGLAAVKHELGKLQLSPELLRKKMEPDARERREIERISTYTVQRILDGPFTWEKMKLAIVASGLTLRPTDGKVFSSSSKQVGSSFSWIYSRILSLCTCFDALCTHRPYRQKMKPAEALLFMEKQLATQFDPYLLGRFVTLFRPMIAMSLGGRPIKKVPRDLRRLRRKLARPVLQTLRKELQEFRELKQMRKRTPEQEHRLTFLRRFLAWKLKEAWEETGSSHPPKTS